jgi:hypothetical protein
MARQVTCRNAAICPQLGEQRKCQMHARTDVNDPLRKPSAHRSRSMKFHSYISFDIFIALLFIGSARSDRRWCFSAVDSLMQINATTPSGDANGEVDSEWAVRHSR